MTKSSQEEEASKALVSSAINVPNRSVRNRRVLTVWLVGASLELEARGSADVVAFLLAGDPGTDAGFWYTDCRLVEELRFWGIAGGLVDGSGLRVEDEGVV